MVNQDANMLFGSDLKMGVLKLKSLWSTGSSESYVSLR